MKKGDGQAKQSCSRDPPIIIDSGWRSEMQHYSIEKFQLFDGEKKREREGWH